MEQPTQTVAVVGGGISGMSIAFELCERSSRRVEPLEVVCLESSPQPGGNIRTSRHDGYLCEWGPNGFLDNAPATLTLARRLGLEPRLLRAESAAEERFIYRRGRLRSVPTDAFSFARSGVLSPWGKLRILAEPLARRRPDGDESVFDFAARRIGRAAAEVLVDAMVSGVYAGDPRRLSLAATFPKMHGMEREHGSLFRAMLARKRQAGTSSGGPAGPGGRLTSFRDGLQELVQGLADRLGSRLRCDSPVDAVSDMGRRGFRVHLRDGAPMEVDAVVLACPSRRATELVSAMDPDLAAAMAAIPSAPLAVVHLGYAEEALRDAPTGFGFLVPRGQGARILGTLWSSQIFRGRSSEGRQLLTVMIGGSRDESAVELDDDELLRIIRAELLQIMGITVAPLFKRVIRHVQGIPQYTVGHLDRLARIDERLTSHPGLLVAGNSYRGISVNCCVEEAPLLAERTLEYLAEPDGAA